MNLEAVLVRSIIMERKPCGFTIENILRSGSCNNNNSIDVVDDRMDQSSSPCPITADDADSTMEGHNPGDEDHHDGKCVYINRTAS